MILFSLSFFRPIFTNKFVAHKIESPKVPTYTTGTIGVLLSFSDDDDDDAFFFKLMKEEREKTFLKRL